MRPMARVSFKTASRCGLPQGGSTVPVCHKCAVRFEFIRANSYFFNTSVKCFRGDGQVLEKSGERGRYRTFNLLIKSRSSSKLLRENRVIPRGRVSLSEAYQSLVPFLVTLLQNEEGIKAVHCSLHDLLHFSLSDVRILRVTVTGGTGLPGMDILYWAIAERQRYECLGLSGYSWPILGNTGGLFHTEAFWN